MAYQKVGGTPRFYIDQIQYLKSLNFDFEKWYEDNGYNANLVQAVYSKTIFDTPELFNFDPVNQKRYTFTDTELVNGSVIWDIPTGYSPNATFDGDNLGRYFAILNHNMATENDNDLYANFTWRRYKDSYSGYGVSESGILNNETYQTPFDGCTIINIDRTNLNYNPPHEDANFFTLGISGYDYQVEDDIIKEINIGALSTGIYYDMPTSPDLDLTMSIEFDGVNNIKTLNGSTITQANYHGSPWWYDVDGNRVEPWSVGESSWGDIVGYQDKKFTGVSKRNGRRVWKLKFSYMSDKDLFASNYGSSTYAENLDGYVVGDKDIPNWGQNMITNGTFDSNTTGWIVGSGASAIAHETTTKRTGAGSVKVTLNGIGDWALITETQYLVTKSPSTVKMSCWVYLPSSYDGTFNLLLSHGGSVTESPSQEYTERADYTVKDDWQYVETTFTATNTDDDNWRPYLRVGNSESNYPTANKFIYVDDFQIIQTNDSDFTYSIDNDDSFSAQVLNKISHGEKFIFQPDNTSNNPSDFAIAVLDGDSFSMKRTAWNVYDIEMTIREVW